METKAFLGAAPPQFVYAYPSSINKIIYNITKSLVKPVVAILFLSIVA